MVNRCQYSLVFQILLLKRLSFPRYLFYVILNEIMINGKNPYEEKRLAIAPWKKISSFCVTEETEDILVFAESLATKGIKTYDALHISCAVAAHCEYYLATDKKLINTPIPEIKIVNPIVFVNEMEGE